MKSLALVVVVCALGIPQFAGAQAATDLNCTQCVGSSDIANEAVGTGKIADGSIRSNDLAPGAVKTANLNTSAVTFNKLAPGIRDQLDAAAAAITFVGSFAEDFAVVGAQCPEDRFSIAASCGCSDDDGQSNNGVLAFCATVGDGAIAGCLFDGLTFDPELADPVAQVEAVCMGVTSVDGTPWLASPDGLAPFNANAADAPRSVEETAAWRAGQDEAYRKALADERLKHADYKRRVSSR